MSKEKQYEQLVMENLTNKYTTVYVESNFNFNAPHNFKVVKSDDNKQIADIHFQEGPIKECGVNGVCNEDLINMVLCRLQHFQESEFKCEENTNAIIYLKSALDELRKRTNKRESRGVEGTHIA